MASRILERGLTGIFRSRWGVAVVLAILVLAIVGIGRIFAGSEPDRPPIGSASPAATLSVNPDDEDSVISPGPPPLPTTSPGTAEPEAVAYAFAAAWADHRDVSAKVWHDRLVPNATKDLSDQLAETDPADVPATRVVGRPELVPVGEGLVDAVVTVDSGKLTLRLVAPDGRWLVDSIDWADS
jgi:hypothetical protein